MNRRALQLPSTGETVKRTYELVKEVKDDRKMTGIKCLKCEETSWSVNDIRHKFCPTCDSFHEIIVVRRRARRGS